MTTAIRVQMQADLTAAIRRRDRDVVSVQRTTLAAIGNAEAVDSSGSQPQVGLGANEVDRLELAEATIVAIVVGERDRMRELSTEMGRIGQRDEAARLHTQAAVLDLYLEHTRR